MSTLLQYRQRALSLDPSLGQVETITGLATTSVTCASLAYGTVGARKFSERWLLRPTAALSGGGVAVDRLRFSSDYVSSTGAISHAGTNYADTNIPTISATSADVGSDGASGSYASANVLHGVIGKGVPSSTDAAHANSWGNPVPTLGQIAMLSYAAKPTLLIPAKTADAVLLPAYFEGAH